MRSSELQSVHHVGVAEAPIAVRIFNRLVLMAGAGLTLIAFGAIATH